MILGTAMYAFGVLLASLGGAMAADARREDDLVMGLWAAVGIASGLFLILAGGNWEAWA